MSRNQNPVIHLTGQLRGTTQKEAWIVDGIVTYKPIPGGAVSRELEGYIYPGLFDAHSHPGLKESPVPPSDDEIQHTFDVQKSFGVTHIKDCGGQRNPNKARRPGDPKVIHCGRHIAGIKRYARYLAEEIEPSRLVEVALMQLESSDGWIKLVGDWIDRSLGEDADLLPAWPRSALVDAVKASHEKGGKVTVHTFATETIDDLLIAEVDAIEHGAGMTREHMQEVKRRGLPVTPTVRQITEFPWYSAQAGKYPKYAQRMLNLALNRRKHLEMMLEEDVPLVMGSDSAFDDIDFKSLAVELVTAVSEGIPDSVAMKAASYLGRELMGLSTWEEGSPADFVVYTRDPENDITEVTRPLEVLIDGISATNAEP